MKTENETDDYEHSQEITVACFQVLYSKRNN